MKDMHCSSQQAKCKGQLRRRQDGPEDHLIKHIFHTLEKSQAEITNQRSIESSLIYSNQHPSESSLEELNVLVGEMRVRRKVVKGDIGHRLVVQRNLGISFILIIPEKIYSAHDSEYVEVSSPTCLEVLTHQPCDSLVGNHCIIIGVPEFICVLYQQ